MSEEKYALLRTFRSVFEGKPYHHRRSHLGDLVASYLYEGLIALGKSEKLIERVQRHDCVVNLKNVMVGKPARRGDGTFGELVPAVVAVIERGLLVARGPVATIEIGAETKTLAKAMIKQIDRVIGDLIKQVTHFKAAAETRSASHLSASTSPSSMSRSRVGRNGRLTVNAINIRSKKLLKPSSAWLIKHDQHSTSFSSCGFAPRI